MEFFDKLTDIELLARLIYGEARGEVYEGKIAVAWVAMNRAAHPSWWGNTLRECILKPDQFSCFLPAYVDVLITPVDDVWLGLVNVAYGVMSNRFEDPSLGATHYHAAWDTPDWAASMTPTIAIGNHIFYK